MTIDVPLYFFFKFQILKWLNREENFSTEVREFSGAVGEHELREAAHFDESRILQRTAI